MQTYTTEVSGEVRKTQEEINAAKNNQQFENYYKGLKLLDDEEFEVFYQKLKEPLDISFRVNSIDKHLKRTLGILEDKINKILSDPDTASKAPA